jgi:hypothetical protein
LLASQTVRPTAYCLLLVLYLTTPVWADFQTGADAYNSGDYTTALHEFRLLAEQGHAVAQYNLGLLYVEGRASPRTMLKRVSGTRKLPPRGTRMRSTASGYCMTRARAYPRTTRKHAGGTRRPPIRLDTLVLRNATRSVQTHGADLLQDAGNLNTKGQHHE